MKRLFIIISLILLSISSEAQFIISRNNYVPPAVAGGAPADTLGSEMIQNGNFSSFTGWVDDDTWAPGAGVYDFLDVNTGEVHQTSANMTIAIEASTTYRLEFDVNLTGQTARIGVWNSAISVNYKAYAYYTGVTHIVIRFTTAADISGGGILFITQASEATAAFYIDNVTLKEVL